MHSRWIGRFSAAAAAAAGWVTALAQPVLAPPPAAAVRPANPQQCAAACATDPQCRSWTWIKPGAQNPMGRCQPSAEARLTTDPCCVSGLKGSSLSAPMAAPAMPPLERTIPESKAIAPGATATAGPSTAAPAAKPAELPTSKTIKAPPALGQHTMDRPAGPSALPGPIDQSKPLTEQGGQSMVDAGIVRPKVQTINNLSPKGFVLRPGQPLTLRGVGLGTSGTLHLAGSFRKSLVIAVNDWRPGVIYARMPDAMPGEDNLADVRLEVQPSGKSPIVITGLRFEAGAAAGASASPAPASVRQPPKAAYVATPRRVANPAVAQAEQRARSGLKSDNTIAQTLYKQSKALSDVGSEAAVESGALSPRIESINGKRPSQVVLRPGSYLLIQGVGFHWNAGRVNFATKDGPPRPLAVLEWHPKWIWAQVPDDFGGEADSDAVGLSVTPFNDRPISVGGLHFEAALGEPILLTDIPKKYVDLGGVNPAPAYGANEARQRYSAYANISTTAPATFPGPWAPDVNFASLVPAKTVVVARITHDPDWFSDGTDVYAVPMKRGFYIDHFELWHERTDTSGDTCAGNRGGQYLRGQYQASMYGAGASVGVQWGVWRCHTSTGLNWNVSAYGLNIYVRGPRGVTNPMLP